MKAARRLAIFILTVLAALLAVAATTPNVVSQMKLGLDLNGGFEVLYEASPIQEGDTITTESLIRTARSLERRVDELGTAEPEIWTEGTNRIRVRLADVTNEAEVRNILKQTAELIVFGPDNEIELRGSDFVDGAASAVFDGVKNYNILVEVQDKKKLEEISSRLFGQRIIFMLDDRMLTNPVIQAVMTNGICRITGNYTYEQAKEIADTINLGALPLKLTEKYTQSVGATLGKESLTQTVQAGIFGSLFVVLFMLFFYRLPGFIAVITITLYSWLLLVVHSLLNATMTLPGIAAFVLGIGMAVDANIISYERLKEELRTGKSLMSSVKAGSKRSFRTIMDANITTLVAAMVLFSIGSGAIKGFAITLSFSIVLSVLTNVYLSQWLLRTVVGSNVFRDLRWFGVRPGQVVEKSQAAALPPVHRTFDFVGKQIWYFRASLLITLIGIGSVVWQQFHYGVDFKAGTAIDLALPGSIAPEMAEQIVREAGFAPETLSVGGGSSDRVFMRFDSILNPDGSDAARIAASFHEHFGEEVNKEEHTVDPEIAREFARQAIVAILIAGLCIGLYVCFRFEWKFAAGALVALLHDVLFVVGAFSLFRLEVNLPFIAAMLTIIGYSINDTIVIFDRIRENLRFSRPTTTDELKRLVNLSVNQTLARSLNTMAAVLVTCVALLTWGSESIRMFSLAMTIGMLIGAYSSIYIASQVWLLLKKRSFRSMEAVRRETDAASSLTLPPLMFEDDKT